MKQYVSPVLLNEDKRARVFWSSITAAIIIIALCKLLWPWAIPFGTFEPWHITGGFGAWLGSAWPFFLWAAALSGTVALIKLDELNEKVKGRHIAVVGTILSAIAGIFEEIGYRWLLFFSGIVGARVMNWILGGFMDAGLIEWLHLTLLGPLADWTTLGHLTPYLFHEYGWYVGAGMLATNATFRDGHKYQGALGYINSWFLGMFFFWCMFTYGMLAAIILHFLYDVVIFGTKAIFVGLRNMVRGNTV